MSYELAPGSTQATHPLVNPVLQGCRNQPPLVRPAILVGRKAPWESVIVPTQPRMGEDDPILHGFHPSFNPWSTPFASRRDVGPGHQLGSFRSPY